MNNDYNDLRTYALAEKIGERVVVQFAQPMPLPPQQPGAQPGLAFADQGKLLNVFNDGVLLRVEKAERFYAWKQLAFIEFPSAVALSLE